MRRKPSRSRARRGDRHGQEDQYRCAESGGGHASSATVRRTLPATRAHAAWRCRGADAVRRQHAALAAGCLVESQRHWHAKEDEFIYVLSGEVVLATDAGEEVLRAGERGPHEWREPISSTCRPSRRFRRRSALERLAPEFVALLLAASANCRCSRRSKVQSSPQNRWNPT
jgi:hypothetical protein